MITMIIFMPVSDLHLVLLLLENASSYKFMDFVEDFDAKFDKYMYCHLNEHMNFLE